MMPIFEYATKTENPPQLSKTVIKQTSSAILTSIAVVALFGQIISRLFTKIALNISAFTHTHWNNLLDKYGDDVYTVWVTIPILSMLASYIIVAVGYTIFDICTKINFLKPYKVQEESSEFINFKKLSIVIAYSLFNLSIVNGFLGYFYYRIILWRGYSNPRIIPNVQTIIWELTIELFVHEIILYYAHRLLHTKHFYKSFHKLHHEFHVPIAAAVFYSNPIDYAFINALPTIIGAVFLGSHPFTLLIWYIGSIIVATHTHSGYHIPFMLSPQFHDYHHAKFNECFGTFGFMDYIHGTDKKFRASSFYDRHSVVLSLTPIKEIVPDLVKEKKHTD